MNNEKITGILGGMGPEATVDLFAKIVKATKATKDQEHLRVVIYNNPKILDRTSAILGKGQSPLPMLIESARVLEKSGANFIVIPCVTAHFFHAELQGQIAIPILHIVDETVNFIRLRYPDINTVGVVATSGTLRTKLFDTACGRLNIGVVTPDPEIQVVKVMEAVYGGRGVKAVGPSEYAKNLVREAAETLIERGAQAIIAGCTEIPLVLKEGDVSVPVIDPLGVLAERAVAFARSGES